MRLGINVPNELLKRVKEIRPQVNVSKVCREALEHRVEIAERAKAQAIDDGLDEPVARLAQFAEAPPIEPDWVAYALDDARNWTQSVTPEDWKMFIYQSDFRRAKGWEEADMVDHWSGSGDDRGLTYRLYVMGESKEWFEHQFEEQFESGGPDLHEKAREEYSRAWLGYVHEARRKLEKLHKEEYDRVMAERAEYRQSRPAPELPQQLL